MDNEEKYNAEDLARQKMTESINWALFAPVDGRPMKRRYPELAEIKEFEPLSDAQLRFTWLYACMSSPIIHMGDEDRLNIACRVAFGKTSQSVNIKKYLSGDFDETVRVAVKRMSLFSPTIRMKGKQAAQIWYDNIMKLTEPFNQDDLDIMDSVEKAKYLDMVSKANDLLPKIISTLEEGFGIIELKDVKNKKNVGANIADLVLSMESDN